MSPLTLPIAQLRNAGCKVGTVIGHDPYVGGSHPNGRPNWHYSVTLPEGRDELVLHALRVGHLPVGEDVSVRLFRGNRVILYAKQGDDPKVKTPAQLRAVRREVERQVSLNLTRLSEVIA